MVVSSAVCRRVRDEIARIAALVRVGGDTPLVDTSGWVAVRCIFRLSGSETSGDLSSYEERVTLWRADDHDAAILSAEIEAREYANTLDGEYLELAQAYAMADQPGDGTEIFSLIRDSTLNHTEYLTAFFDTGYERQANALTDGP
jgi:hypothetical protein